MTLKFVIILQNLIKAYHRKSGKSKYDRELTELDVETTRIRLIRSTDPVTPVYGPVRTGSQCTPLEPLV